jgi:hypothetical protein
MKQSQLEVVRDRIRHRESELDRAYFRKEELTKKLKTCGVRERASIEREISALQTQIDYHGQQHSDAQAEEFELERHRSVKR